MRCIILIDMTVLVLMALLVWTNDIESSGIELWKDAVLHSQVS